MKRVYTPVKKKTVLIVHDDQIAVHIYRKEFQSEGYKVDVAGDGVSALQRLKQDRVDLMILDLSLPGMNGVEVLKKIRSEFDVDALPIIALSNTYLGSVARDALEAGANQCVAKGSSAPGQILELVRELLAFVGNVTKTFAAESETELQQQQLAATLLTNAPDTLAKLRTGSHLFARMEPGDLLRTKLSEMQRLVRSLAGSAGLIGFPKIGQMADALEALLIELQTKPEKITPSVSRTVAQSIDTLASLFDRAGDTPIDEALPSKILVVDDEIISRETICSALGKAGLQAVSLDDSLAAERLLEQDRFDLIFLDVEMPGQSGLQLCVKIREMAANHATPIVFVTAHSDFGSRAQSTLSGGSDFIAKPFLTVELAVKALAWLLTEKVQSPSIATRGAAKPEPKSLETQCLIGATS